MSTVTMVGIGPGDPDLLTLKGRDLIESADVVAGFESVLAPVRRWVTGEVFLMRYANQEASLDALAEEAGKGRKCVICAWGDVNFSASELVERVKRRFSQVELQPGISSVQMACSRLGLPIEKTLWATLHAREGGASALQEAADTVVAGARHLLLLPRPWDIMPPGIARALLQHGVSPSARAHVLQRLTLPDESISSLSLGELAESEDEFSDLSIMAVPRSPAGTLGQSANA